MRARPDTQTLAELDFRSHDRDMDTMRIQTLLILCEAVSRREIYERPLTMVVLHIFVLRTASSTVQPPYRPQFCLCLALSLRLTFRNRVSWPKSSPFNPSVPVVMFGIHSHGCPPSATTCLSNTLILLCAPDSSISSSSTLPRNSSVTSFDCTMNCSSCTI